MLVLAKHNYPETPASKIPLQNGFFALVDPEWFDRLIWHTWYAKKSEYRYYACRKILIHNRIVFVRMHRLIAETPPDMVCHHINGNSLDNRRANLQNMFWFDHVKQHSYR